MYLSYYNLNDWPFQINSDPRFLWLGEKHKEALSTLIYGVQDRRAFLLLTGDVGTGKTTLVNSLLEKLDESVLVGNITDPKLELLGFLNVAAMSLGIPGKSDAKEDFLSRFARFLNEKYAEGKYVLLIIDEAHTLSADHLEQIRLLSNIELPERRLISIFLVGQDELNETLTSYECRALRQRISLISRVEPLSEEETVAYIRHRLKVAGTERHLFSKPALREIHRFSRGYPRLINIICDRALLTGYVRGLNKITPTHVRECGREMLLPGESIELNQSPPKQPEQVSSVLTAGEHPEKPELMPLVQPPATSTETPLRSRALSPGTDGKSPSHRAFWACLLLLILTLAAVSQSTFFFSREKKETAVPENARVEAQDPPVLSKAEPPPPGIPAATTQTAVTGAAAVPATDAQAEFHEIGPTPPHPDEESPHPAVEAMPGSTEKSAVDLVEEAFRRQDFEEAIALYEMLAAGDPSPLPRLQALYLDALINQAERLSDNDPFSSQDLLNKAVSADPGNLRALLRLAKLHTDQKQYDKALETYQKAASLDPGMPGVFFNLGFLYAAEGEHSLAEGAFLRAVELDPPYLDQALFNLAVVQDKMGKREASFQTLKKALEANPGNRKVRELLERITREGGNPS